MLEQAGIEHRLYLPHVGFNRKVGLFAGHHVTPTGDVVSAEAWEAKPDALAAHRGGQDPRARR